MFSSYKILESGGIFGIHGGDFKNKPQNTVFEGAPRDRDGARGLEHRRPVPGGVGRNLPARGHGRDGPRGRAAGGKHSRTRKNTRLRGCRAVGVRTPARSARGRSGGMVVERPWPRRRRRPSPRDDDSARGASKVGVPGSICETSRPRRERARGRAPEPRGARSRANSLQRSGAGGAGGRGAEGGAGSAGVGRNAYHTGRV